MVTVMGHRKGVGGRVAYRKPSLHPVSGVHSTAQGILKIERKLGTWEASKFVHINFFGSQSPPRGMAIAVPPAIFHL